MPNYNARLLLAWSDAWNSVQLNWAITEALIPSLQEGHQQNAASGRRTVQEAQGEKQETKWGVCKDSETEKVQGKQSCCGCV